MIVLDSILSCCYSVWYSFFSTNLVTSIIIVSLLVFVASIYISDLGHSKYGVYVCKYADVCIRRASVRRTWEGNVAIKMLIFKVNNCTTIDCWHRCLCIFRLSKANKRQLWFAKVRNCNPLLQHYNSPAIVQWSRPKRPMILRNNLINHRYVRISKWHRYDTSI
jgi:hypothetical protein